MKLPRVRFTVRRLMVAVAIVALMLGWIASLRATAGRRRAIADDHESVLAGQGIVRTGTGGSWYPVDDKPTSEREAVVMWRIQLADMYRAAADQPWLRLAPDPPEPE